MTSLSPGPADLSQGGVVAELHQGWTVRASAGPVPAAVVGVVVPADVPGCVHTDLLAAKLIDNPFVDDNEVATRWVGLTDWEYRTSFAWAPNGHQRHELVFEGLDTIATVALNGEILGVTDNMHRTWRFEVGSQLVGGQNELVVSFQSPLAHAARRSLEIGMLPNPYPSAPFHAIRKMASSFGWDWGPSTATSGIWRAVRLVSWSNARLARVLVDAEPTGEGGLVRVRVRCDRLDDRPLTVAVHVAGVAVEAPVTGTETDVVVAVPNVSLWWPRGHGAQPLYSVSITLSESGHALDTAQRRVGFRRVNWDTTPDPAGTPFALHVNGERIYIKGVNWIPDDAFVTRVTTERYRERLAQAVDGNVNLVRVWGGGVFEADAFYDLCDELGLLVWQDFLMSCSAYSEEPWLVASVEAEGRDNLVRIGHHASLALLNGSNENLVAFEEWDWQRMLGDRPWGAHYYHTLFPALVDELTPTIPYVPSSPFSPGGQAANAADHATVHIWDIWNERDWLGYYDYAPRMVVEFGWQGPPAWSTLTDAVHGDLSPESALMEAHQKARWGNFKLLAGLVPHFPVPRTAEAWHWAMQLNQTMAIRAALTHFRSLAPLNAGAVIWQLNDCWPGISWAMIDGAGRRKPAWYAMRDAFADRVVSVQPDGEDLHVIVGNDTSASWSGTLRLRRLDYEGRPLASDQREVSVPARGSIRIPVEAAIATPGSPASELLVADLDQAQDHWFYAEPRSSELCLPRWQVALERDDADWLVRICPDVLVRDAFLMVDKIAPSAQVDTGPRTVLPGEWLTLRVTGADVVDPESITRTDVLRCANQLVVGGKELQ